MKRYGRKFSIFSGILALWFLGFILYPSISVASLMPSMPTAHSKSFKADMEKARLLLERKVVSQRLADYGLSKEEVLKKLDKLSPEQIHQLASLENSLADGEDAFAIIGVTVVVLLIVWGILKLLDVDVVLR